jgi:hypothetical protein
LTKGRITYRKTKKDNYRSNKWRLEAV